MRRLVRSLLLTTALVPLSIPVQANPLDSNVVAGTATVAGEGTAAVVVNQQSDKAIIDWRSFNIGVGEGTTFVQPGSQSVTLNRVIGGEGASQILGTLKANGQVFLINPDGILFGKDATVDVGGLVATTHDILNSDFMAGNYRFDQTGNPQASIVNLGTITVEDSGFAALVAPGVRNAGVIRANLGKIALASANQFTLDFYGDELLTLAVDDVTAGSVVDLETGQSLQDLVSNSGLLSANGGTVALTASAARAVVNSVINNTGNIEADTVGTRNGKIILGAATANAKPSDAPVQSVKVSGTLSAVGHDVGETGGAVEITGELIELTVATIDAFGWSGGGKVLIGGDYMGGNGDAATIEQFGIELESEDVPTASYLFADEGTTITADGLQSGDGGKIILWSDIATVTAAELVARGGAQAGDGGFIETSGKYLAALVVADASAPNGKAGTWLLDPLDVHVRDAANSNFASTTKTIYPGITGDSTFPTANPSVVSVANVEAALNSGTNVRLTTRGTTGTQPGDIYVEDDITKSAGGDVFAIIDSARNVYFTSGITLRSTSGKVSFLVYAKNGKVVAKNLRVDVNGGQFLIESSEVSPSLLKMTTIGSILAEISNTQGPQCLVGATQCVAPEPPIVGGNTDQSPVGVRPASAPKKGLAYGEVKGTIDLEIAGVSYTLNAYSNMGGVPLSEGRTSDGLDFQCVELISRYAGIMTEGGGSITGLGNGKDVASNLPNATDGAFGYFPSGSMEPPIEGAVISINLQGALSPYGHVGIAQKISGSTESGTITVTLFDQNWPTDVGGAWKTVTFVRSPNGTWSGTMLNSGVPQTVVGWSNPTAG